jgi:hypothetical protein
MASKSHYPAAFNPTIMKRFNYLTLGFWALAISFSSCDEIENPVLQAYEYRKDLYGAPTEPPIIEVATQRVLLEDFTGQDCGNCPAAHTVASNILEANEEHVALVAIHAGSLAEPFGEFVDDWRTEAGEFYLLGQIGSDQLPTGRVNRLGGANASSNFADWNNLVNAELAQEPLADIAFSAELEAANNHLNLHVRNQYTQSISGQVKLVILILQGPIIAPQLNYAADPEFVADYEHKHMLRGTGTGATGLTVATNPIAGQEDVIHYTLDWNPNWVAEDVEIIAFLTAGDSGEVINVNKIDLIP